jgi:hypothetical protein
LWDLWQELANFAVRYLKDTPTSEVSAAMLSEIIRFLRDNAATVDARALARAATVPAQVFDAAALPFASTSGELGEKHTTPATTSTTSKRKH